MSLSVTPTHTPSLPQLCRSPDRGGRPVPYDGGEGRVRKFRQEDFQDEDDDEKKKSTYNGNSTQQQ